MCPDCVLEKRRLAAIAKAPAIEEPTASGFATSHETTKPEVVRPTRLAPIGTAAVSEDVVAARDAAVLACLRKAPASFSELLAAMPYESALDIDGQREALNRSLSRLRMKTRQIRSNGSVWELANALV